MVRTSVHDAQWTPHQTYAEFSAGWGVATRVLTAQYAARHSAESVRQNSRRFIPDAYELRVGCVPQTSRGFLAATSSRPSQTSRPCIRPSARSSNLQPFERHTRRGRDGQDRSVRQPLVSQSEVRFKLPGRGSLLTRAQFGLVEALKGGRGMRRRLSRRGSGISGAASR